LRLVEHFPVGVEGGEMHGNVRTQVLNHPRRHLADLGSGVVFVWNQQVGDLD
jgi:hypothetical protein